MKEFNRHIIKVTIALLLFTPITAGFPLMGQSPWDYPVKPGSEKWKTFKTHDEMVAACQIPEDILSSLSTKDLLETCLGYPLLSDVFLLDNIANGVSKITESFNGLAALFDRKDCNKVILESYKNERLPEIKSKEATKYFRMFFMELIISTSGILEKLDEDDRTELMRIALDKINEKKEMDYSIFYQSGSILILSRILYIAGLGDDIRDNFGLNTSNDSTINLTQSSDDNIISLTLKYLDSHEQD